MKTYMKVKSHLMAQEMGGVSLMVKHTLNWLNAKTMKQMATESC